MAERGRPRRVNCRHCGRHIDECGALSRRGKCMDCGIARNTTNAMDISSHSGEQFQRWRAKTIASVGGIVPDELKKYLD